MLQFPFQSLSRVLLVTTLLAGLAFSQMQCKTSSSAAKKSARPIRVLMVGGGTSHNFGMWYRNVDGQTLTRDGLATVNYVGDPDSIMLYLPQADVLYLSNNRAIPNENVRQAITKFASDGKGVIIAHAALWYNWKDWAAYNQTIAGGGSRGHDKYGAFDVTVDEPKHPIMKGVEPKFNLRDERYYYIPDPAGPGVEVLASSSVAGSDKVFPSVFVVKNPSTRIVGIALGHDADSHNIANYQTLLRNAVQWAARN